MNILERRLDKSEVILQLKQKWSNPYTRFVIRQQQQQQQQLQPPIPQPNTPNSNSTNNNNDNNNNKKKKENSSKRSNNYSRSSSDSVGKPPLPTAVQMSQSPKLPHNSKPKTRKGYYIIDFDNC